MLLQFVFVSECAGSNFRRERFCDRTHRSSQAGLADNYSTIMIGMPCRIWRLTWSALKGVCSHRECQHFASCFRVGRQCAYVALLRTPRPAGYRTQARWRPNVLASGHRLAALPAAFARGRHADAQDHGLCPTPKGGQCHPHRTPRVAPGAAVASGKAARGAVRTPCGAAAKTGDLRCADPRRGEIIA